MLRGVHDSRLKKLLIAHFTSFSYPCLGATKNVGFNCLILCIETCEAAIPNATSSSTYPTNIERRLKIDSDDANGNGGGVSIGDIDSQMDPRKVARKTKKRVVKKVGSCRGE